MDSDGDEVAGLEEGKARLEAQCVVALVAGIPNRTPEGFHASPRAVPNAAPAWWEQTVEIKVTESQGKIKPILKGGIEMGRGCRNMYYLTGQPGWMRLGYSPGWVGRSRSGLGPCAEYFLTGRWPGGVSPFASAQAPFGASGELEVLKAQAERLEQTLSQIKRRIEELKEKGD